MRRTKKNAVKFMMEIKNRIKIIRLRLKMKENKGKERKDGQREYEEDKKSA